MICVLVKTFCLLSAVFITANCQPTLTPSSKYLCLRDVVELTCTAQISATWRSDDILGPRQSIDFLNGDSINKSVTVGDGTGVLIETDPRIVTSLSFNLNTDGVDTHCTDSQLRTTTTKSSVQPGPNGKYPLNISGGSITWDPPSNIGDFLLQNYQLTIECNGAVVDGVNTTNTTYSYDEGKLIPGLCNVTVRVINSCGDTASNSILMEGATEVSTEGESNTGLRIALGIGISLYVIMVIVIQIIVIYYYKKKNKLRKLIQDTKKKDKLTQDIEEKVQELISDIEGKQGELQKLLQDTTTPHSRDEVETQQGQRNPENEKKEKLQKLVEEKHEKLQKLLQDIEEKHEKLQKLLQDIEKKRRELQKLEQDIEEVETIKSKHKKWDILYRDDGLLLVQMKGGQNYGMK